jgi:hypothetical protein
LSEGFFAENHDDAGDHGDGVDDAGQTDPFFAFGLLYTCAFPLFS